MASELTESGVDPDDTADERDEAANAEAADPTSRARQTVTTASP